MPRGHFVGVPATTDPKVWRSKVSSPGSSWSPALPPVQIGFSPACGVPDTPPHTPLRERDPPCALCPCPSDRVIPAPHTPCTFEREPRPAPRPLPQKEGPTLSPGAGARRVTALSPPAARGSRVRAEAGWGAVKRRCRWERGLHPEPGQQPDSHLVTRRRAAAPEPTCRSRGRGGRRPAPRARVSANRYAGSRRPATGMATPRARPGGTVRGISGQRGSSEKPEWVKSMSLPPSRPLASFPRWACSAEQSR